MHTRTAHVKEKELHHHRPKEYGEIVARSLIAYAKRDEDFSDILSALIREAQLGTEHIFEEFDLGVNTTSGIIALSEQAAAIRRTEWLMARTRDGALAGTLCATEILSNWAKDRESEEPKALIIGEIVGIVPTVGIGQPKKKTRMAMIMRRDIDLTSLHSYRYATHASLALLMKALASVKGDLRKLEPEISEWVFGDREMVFYSAEKRAMREIEEELYNQNICFGSSPETDAHILAISPAVNETFALTHWNISELDND